MVFKIKGGPLVHSCYRNTKCEIQSDSKAKLYIGGPQTPWEPYILSVCVRGLLSTYKEGPFSCNVTSTFKH